MVRRVGFLLVVVGALAVVQAASAAYPTPFAAQGGAGLPGLDGSVRFVSDKVSPEILRGGIDPNDGRGFDIDE